MQSSLNKFTTNQRHHVPFWTSINQNLFVETHLSKIGKTYVCFVFSTKFGNTSLLKVFSDGKTTQEHNCIAKHFS